MVARGQKIMPKGKPQKPIPQNLALTQMPNAQPRAIVPRYDKYVPQIEIFSVRGVGVVPGGARGQIGISKSVSLLPRRANFFSLSFLPPGVATSIIAGFSLGLL